MPGLGLLTRLVVKSDDTGRLRMRPRTVLGSQRLQLITEPRLDRAARLRHHPDDQRTGHRRDDRNDQKTHRVAHADPSPGDGAAAASSSGDGAAAALSSGDGAAAAAVMCWASRPHDSPSRHVSRFQIGTDAFSVSIPNRAAAKASGRCGAEATTTTELSPTGTTPIRWINTTRPNVGHRFRISVAIAANRGTTCSSYASYSSNSTSSRPGA